MFKVLLFAGTTEGRLVAEFLNQGKVNTYVCVTTEYGEELLPKGENIKVSHERLDYGQMTDLINEIHPEIVVDGTHPYAAEATENIAKACKLTETEYIRVIRNTEHEKDPGNCIYVKNVDEAVEYLKNTEGNILATTGSKEIEKYTEIPGFKERVFARVLSLPKVAEACSELGFEGRNLICMQGPFSKEMNVAMLKQYNCKYLVTKISGKTGGYQDKINAASEAGCISVIVGKPVQEKGISLSQCIKLLGEKYSVRSNRTIFLVGIGAGNTDSLTIEAKNIIDKADLLIGAKRMTESVKRNDQNVFVEYNSEKIKDYIDSNPQYNNVAVLLSGDTGFYSGAKKLVSMLHNYNVQVIPGISSLVYFMARIKRSWDDVYITSAHGRQANLIDQIRTHEKVFSILGSGTYAGEIATRLTELGLKECRIFIGENLSYKEEKILSGKAEELAGYAGDALSVIYIENPDCVRKTATHGIKDYEFIRGKVPMTKEEVRAVSLAKLKLYNDSVCFDIGAGTGSVSIEMAMRVTEGKVIAIEKKMEAVELIKQNRNKFRLGNLEVIQGEAPEALDGLETPSHAFIGGSSGSMREIIDSLLKMNPEIRVVINCIAMETVSETVEILKEIPVKDLDIIQLSVSRAKELGRYHLMMGENPITIISFTGDKK